MFAPKVAKAKTKLSESPISKLAPQRSTFVTRSFGADAVEQAHMLQRGIGNQAMLRLPVQRSAGTEPHGHDEQEAGPASLTTRGATPGVSWDFSRIPLFPPDRASRSQATEFGAGRQEQLGPEGPPPIERETEIMPHNVRLEGQAVKEKPKSEWTLSDRLYGRLGADYSLIRPLILSASLSERRMVLADLRLLGLLLTNLGWDFFAKTVELLGRDAPLVDQLLKNAAVQRALEDAWVRSEAGDIRHHEEGGWIYMEVMTGQISTRDVPRQGGESEISLSNPPDVDGSVLVGTYHTHPQGEAEGFFSGPSPTDIENAFGEGLPRLIRAQRGETFVCGPAARSHLAGPLGFPGALGEDAP